MSMKSELGNLAAQPLEAAVAGLRVDQQRPQPQLLADERRQRVRRRRSVSARKRRKSSPAGEPLSPCTSGIVACFDRLAGRQLHRRRAGGQRQVGDLDDAGHVAQAEVEPPLARDGPLRPECDVDPLPLGRQRDRPGQADVPPVGDGEHRERLQVARRRDGALGADEAARRAHAEAEVVALAFDERQVRAIELQVPAGGPAPGGREPQRAAAVFDRHHLAARRDARRLERPAVGAGREIGVLKISLGALLASPPQAARKRAVDLYRPCSQTFHCRFNSPA